MLFGILYLADGLLNLFAEYYGPRLLNYTTKALLMPLLILYLLNLPGKPQNRKWLLGALFFSWCGDVFLMFPKYHSDEAVKKLLFVCGLVAFLIAHISYITAFVKDITRSRKVSMVGEKPYLVLPFLIFLILLLRILTPYLGPMKWPVYLYGCCITLMSLMAFNRYKMVSPSSYNAVFAGALLFLASDNILALNLFYRHFEMASLMIMLTYVAGQWLIIYGAGKNAEPN
jgi:uncharacterized membrane protein YhhN